MATEAKQPDLTTRQLIATKAIYRVKTELHDASHRLWTLQLDTPEAIQQLQAARHALDKLISILR